MGQITAAAAMQHILSEVQQQHLDMFGQPMHKGDRRPSNCPSLASTFRLLAPTSDADEVTSAGSTGLALLYADLEIGGQLVRPDDLLQAVWEKMELPNTAQTLDVLLHAPARGHNADNEIARFKELVRTRMNDYIESFNPSLAPTLRAARGAINGPSDSSLFVPMAMKEDDGSRSWSNRLFCHVLDIQPRTAVSLCLVQTTTVRIPHLGVRHPREDCLYIQLLYPNLGAVLFFEIRKIWINLDPTCPLRPTHRSQSLPVAYASLFNLILLGDLRRHDVDNEMCRVDNFPRIAHDILGNSHDDHGQREFFSEFRDWVRQTFDNPQVRDKVVDDMLRWLHQESPLVATLHVEFYDEKLKPELREMITRQLKHVVELLE